MMTRTAAITALAVVALTASSASAQTNDHFARQRREVIARQHFGHQRTSIGHANVSHHGSGHHSSGHWGGTTTTHRWHPSMHGHAHHQNIQFYPVYPFGYGIPGYGFYGGISPYYRMPHYGASFGPSIYIYREIYHSR